MKARQLILFFFFFFFSPAARTASAQPEGATKKIAVLDFAARGVSAEVAANVADVVAATISRVEGYAVISKADINAMLGFEQQKQMLGCDNPSCMSQFGSILGVDHIVTGSVGQLGEKISLSISMVGVRDAKPMGRGQEEVGDAGQLPDAARRAVAAMLGTKKPLVLLKGKGGIFIATSPEGARVFLDGMEQQGATPLTLDGVSAGDHNLKVELGDLARTVPVLVEPDKISKLNLTLAVVRAKFLSVPFDATVFIDGIERGTTPLLIADISAQKHRVEFRKKGYAPHVEEVLFELTTFRKTGGEAVEVKAQLMPEAVAVRVSGDPEGAAVFVDGNERGTTPVDIKLMPGEYRLAVRLKGYRAHEEQLQIKPADRLDLAPKLDEYPEHRGYVEETGLRRTLNVVGLISGGAALAAGGGLAVLGWTTQGKAEDKIDAYNSETSPARLAALKNDYKELNDAARMEAGLGYAFLSLGAAALAGVLVNRLTYPEEPEYGRSAALEKPAPEKAGASFGFTRDIAAFSIKGAF